MILNKGGKRISITQGFLARRFSRNINIGNLDGETVNAYEKISHN